MLEPCRKDVAKSIYSIYSTVIHTSQEDSTVLAVCFGNRSAVLYELGGRNEVGGSSTEIPFNYTGERILLSQECLHDIKQALSFGFPDTSEYKLHRRRACCLAQMGLKEEAHNGREHSMVAWVDVVWQHIHCKLIQPGLVVLVALRGVTT